MRRRWWGVSAGLAVAGMGISAFNAGEWFEIQRTWVAEHPLPSGRIPWELAMDDGARVAAVVFSTLFALAAAIPALVIVSWLARRAGRSATEAILAAALTWPVFGLLASRIEEVLATGLGLGQEAFDLLVPPTEEVLLLGCACAVLLARPQRGLRAAIALGLATGIGMNVWETAFYVQAGWVLSSMSIDQPGQWTTVGLRAALLGFGLHAITAAVSTLGVALALRRPAGVPRLLPVMLALAASIAVHGLWNATATGLVAHLSVLAGGIRVVDDPGVAFAVGSLVAVPYLAFPILVLVVAWRRGGPDRDLGMQQPVAEGTNEPPPLVPAT
jgi:hypothetical protein